MNNGIGIPERHFIASTILSKDKYIERLKPLYRASAVTPDFDKACRGYAIGLCQKKGFNFTPLDINAICSEVYSRFHFSI